MIVNHAEPEGNYGNDWTHATAEHSRLIQSSVAPLVDGNELSPPRFIETYDNTATNVNSPQTRSPVRCLPISEFVQCAAPDYSIKGVIPRRGIGVAFGDTGAGKTFEVLDMIMHIAQGKAWRGHRVKRGGGIYISAEGSSGLGIRLRAYVKHHELNTNTLPLEVVPVNVNLLNPGEQLDELITAIDDARGRIGDISLIVIDTLNRTMQGGDENSGEDMGAYLNHIAILANSIDAFVLIVHHCGKDASRGARGHSSLKAAVDLEMEVTKTGSGDRITTLSKMRDGEDGTQFGFRLEIVELGMDADGDPITSCVVVPTEVTKRRENTLSGVAQVALQALQEAIGTHGKVMPPTSCIPGGVSAVKMDEWRTQFKLRYGSDGSGDDRGDAAVKKAFQRAREALAKVQAVGVSDPFVWMTRK